MVERSTPHRKNSKGQARHGKRKTAIKGPGLRIRHGMRRKWHCPRCSEQAVTSCDHTSQKCACQPGGVWMTLLEEEPPPFDFTPPEIDPSHKPDDLDFEFELEDETPTAAPAVSTVELGLSAASAAAFESNEVEPEEATTSSTASSSSSDDDDFAAGLDEPDEDSTAEVAEPTDEREAPALIGKETASTSGVTDEAAAVEPAAVVKTGDDADSDSATDGKSVETTEPDGEKSKRRRRRKPRRGRKKDRGGKSDDGNSSSGGPAASGG
jgi:hypothetical protein